MVEETTPVFFTRFTDQGRSFQDILEMPVGKFIERPVAGVDIIEHRMHQEAGMVIIQFCKNGGICQDKFIDINLVGNMAVMHGTITIHFIPILRLQLYHIHALLQFIIHSIHIFPVFEETGCPAIIDLAECTVDTFRIPYFRGRQLGIGFGYLPARLQQAFINSIKNEFLVDELGVIEDTAQVEK